MLQVTHIYPEATNKIHYIRMFQYFVYSSRQVQDYLKSTGICPYKTYLCENI